MTFPDPPEPRRQWPAPMTIGVALASLGLAALITWLVLRQPTVEPVTPPQEVAVPLPPAVSQAPSIEIPDTKTPTRPPIKAIPATPKVREKTKLPPAMMDGKDTFLVATGALQSEQDRSYTLSSTLDRRTGETTINAVADPLPWLGASSRGAVGIHYGIRDGKQIIRASIRHDVMRSKQVFGGVAATLDSDGQWFAGIGAEYRW